MKNNFLSTELTLLTTEPERHIKETYTNLYTLCYIQIIKYNFIHQTQLHWNITSAPIQVGYRVQISIYS